MRWNRFWILGCTTLFLCTFFIQATRAPYAEPVETKKKQDNPIRTIVIDPGHGNQTPGARGKYSTEQEITLDIALKLGRMIENNMKDVRVVYTRRGANSLRPDLRSDLKERANLANREKGDLFISIHCNSAYARVRTGTRYTYVGKGKKRRKVPHAVYSTVPSSAKGTETYIWATSKNNAKMESLKENSVIVLDANSEDAKQVMDMSDPETFILLNTLRNAYFDQSLRLSTLIEDEFTSVGRISRGARQRDEKGIWVLQATAMPSVLVETGFISNPDEEEYLNSERGQEETAACIYKAIKRYKDELERHGNQSSAMPAPQPRQQAAPPPAEQPVVQPVKVSFNTERPRQSSAGASESLVYKVQLLVTDKTYRPGSSIFRKLHGQVEQEAVILNNKRLHKYLWGNFKTEPEANAAVNKARKLGFHDAFVVPYKNGVRIDDKL